MANREKLRELAQFMRDNVPDRSFKMENWAYIPLETRKETLTVSLEYMKGKNFSCGTTCCVAGWEAIRLGYSLGLNGIINDGEKYTHAADVAQLSLGLTHEQYDKLFFHGNWPVQFRKLFPTVADAIARIEYMAETGL